MWRVNRVKELNKDVARRALNHASTTCPADTPRSRCSLTPPSPRRHAEDTPDGHLMTRARADSLVRCSVPSERVSADELAPLVGRGSWFLPVLTPSRQTAGRRHSSTLADVDESSDVCRQPLCTAAALTNDQLDDDRAGSETRTQLPTVAETGMHQSTRSPNSDPAVSLDQQRAKRSVASGVQSDFVLSSTTRSVLTPCLRDAVGQTRAEGDRISSERHPLNSSLCSRLGDCVSRGGCRPQSDTKASSKLDDIFGDCLAANRNLICCRYQQDIPDKMTYGATTNRLNAAENTADSTRNAAADCAMTTTTNVDDNCQSQSQHARHLHGGRQVTTPSKQQTPVSVNSVNKKTGCSSPPNNAKLFAELINRISELATRQDKLERMTPTSRRAVADKSSQTACQEPQTPLTPCHVLCANSWHQQPDRNDGNKARRRADERTRKQRGTDESCRVSHTPDQRISNQTSSAVRSIRAASTKLTSFSRAAAECQRDDAEQQQQAPGHSTPLTDNIIHIVRGSSALDDLTVEQLVSQYCQPSRVFDQQPRTQAAASSLPVDGAPGRSTPQDDHQLSPKQRDDGGRRQDTDSMPVLQRRDQDDTKRSPGPRRDSATTSQDVASCRHSEHDAGGGVKRTADPLETTGEDAKLRMQYVATWFILVGFFL